MKNTGKSMSSTRCQERPHRLGVQRVTLGFVVTLAVFVGWVAAGPACAASPWWHVVTNVRPSNLPPGGEGVLSVRAVNVGDAPTSGAVTLSDVLPSGVSVAEAEIEPEVFVPAITFFTSPLTVQFDFGTTAFLRGFHLCSATGDTVSCVLKPEVMKLFEGIAPGAQSLRAFENIEIQVKVKASNSAPPLGENSASVTGGGARSVVERHTVQVGATPPSFGAEDLSLVPEDEGGAVDTQAGSHPFQLTTTFSLNQNADATRPPALPRKIGLNLPPGLVANATIIPQCTDEQFSAIVNGGTGNLCPQNTAIGVASITIDEPITLHLQTLSVPLFNLTPARGEPVRFGFEFASAPVTIDTAIRTGGDYGATVSVKNITELLNFLSTSITIWGVPGDSRHDEARGWGCLAGGKLAPGTVCNPSSETQPPPFLTLPTSCSLPFTTSVEGNSWPTQTDPAGVSLATDEHGRYTLQDEFERPLLLTGCNELQFSPSIEVQPDVQSASSPTGLTVHVRVPQEVNANPLGLASSSVKDITVTLPEGVSVNPAGGSGLEACSESEIGFEREEAASERDLFNARAPMCPGASKIGTVEISSPLLPATQHLKGSVYLATPAPFEEQGNNPFNSLIAMYLIAEDPVSGVLVKLPGKATLDESTGRLTTTFKNSPQLPFDDAELHFFGGSRAPLATPALCRRSGEEGYTTLASFGPWSGNPLVESTSEFDVISGPNGGACPNARGVRSLASLPFAPSLAAGTTNINAGGFSALTTTVGREDGNQDVQSVALHMPAGLSGILAGVPLCGETQANAGTCGEGSLIGHTTVSVGLGTEPFTVTGGQVFLTEKYQGAPFGLSIVNPADAGPFHLGKVVVRAKIEVDPTTAQLTVVTGTIPHILKGIPLQIKHVNVTIDRPGFTFNPTNCDPMGVTGAISSVEGASSPVQVPFQVTNCKSLAFKPKFGVSTNGKTSRKSGASLHVALAYPKAPFGSQANIAKVKVSLPKQLPSRLSTLQKACSDSVFNHNPASCPPESRIGSAKATTPLLPVPLSGPVYFVSHGGAKFPELVIVLSGYGVTVQLHAGTFISKAGITSSTFRTIPDVPVGTFELTLPQGRFSALAAPSRLCGAKLKMPTAFTAQNGAVIKQSTPIAVTGCPKKKAKHRRVK